MLFRISIALAAFLNIAAFAFAGELGVVSNSDVGERVPATSDGSIIVGGKKFLSLNDARQYNIAVDEFRNSQKPGALRLARKNDINRARYEKILRTGMNSELRRNGCYNREVTDLYGRGFQDSISAYADNSGLRVNDVVPRSVVLFKLIETKDEFCKGQTFSGS